MCCADNFNTFDARPNELVSSGLCALFQAERFAKVVNDLGPLTISSERFVLHD